MEIWAMLRRPPKRPDKDTFCFEVFITGCFMFAGDPERPTQNKAVGTKEITMDHDASP
jgi:hypothetical protein